MDVTRDIRASACRPCPRCGTDLARLAGAARFCPNCGVKLDAGAVGATSSLVAGPARAGIVSVILNGYANAMFRLGTRYEFRHNADEAVRCYGKASQLGNEPAAARLREIPVAQVASGGDVTPVSPPSEG